MNSLEVFTHVEMFFGYSRTELMGKCKIKGLSRARQICMYMLRMDAKLSLPEVGELLNRTHGTVIHGIKMVKNRIKLGQLVRKTGGIFDVALNTSQFEDVLNNLSSFWVAKQMKAFKVDEFNMMMGCNEVADKILNRKD